MEEIIGNLKVWYEHRRELDNIMCDGLHENTILLGDAIAELSEARKLRCSVCNEELQDGTKVLCLKHCDIEYRELKAALAASQERVKDLEDQLCVMKGLDTVNGGI